MTAVPIRRDTGELHTQIEKHVRTEQAKERGLRETKSYWHLDLGLLGSRR